MKHKITLAVEDKLTEYVGFRVLNEFGMYNINIMRRQGFGYLKNRANQLNYSANSIPVLLITDLDQQSCPADIVSHWLKSNPSRYMVFRVAVVAVESWILADSYGFSWFLNISNKHLPSQPDAIQDPKMKLLKLVQYSKKRSLRTDILPPSKGTAKVGPRYNDILGNFVQEQWNLDKACELSPSLLKSIRALKNLTEMLGDL